MTVPNQTVIVLLGLLAGGLWAILLVQSISNRRRRAALLRLVEALSRGDEDGSLRGRLRNRALERAFGDLAARLAGSQLLASTDTLTGVVNRQTTLTLLAREIERATRYDRPLSVALLDIDHFKNVNDIHGHDAGDVILHATAQILRASVRAVDIVGRYGGEEFLVVLPETDVEPAAQAAEHLRRRVARQHVELPDGTTLGVTISLGVAGSSGGRLRLDRLIGDADSALYAAKSLGRDQVYLFRELDESRSIRRASVDPQARLEALEVGRVAADAARDRLAELLAPRAPWAGRPSELIADVAVALGSDLGLSDAELGRIRTASLLHDVGKLAIPDEILSRPGPLSEAERRAVVEHPKIGEIVMEQAGALRDAGALIVHHHEWFNGKGYPHGLSGRDIPLGSRIVAIADAYEAMVGGRPYQVAKTHLEALAELRRCAGTQFDPELVERFAELFAESVESDTRRWTRDEWQAAAWRSADASALRWTGSD